ncbi:hypothetical protein BC351_39390 [Paenibacillus ferrarius]|uniref:Uncharacterized protein n=1 Tax=Paenibacillus ferrarius TaxID=1469647 RepID=A0A1V4H9G4_9BACL|nr:hypothetical protein BC351_39390 [Paenibacillus ferrarius]
MMGSITFMWDDGASRSDQIRSPKCKSLRKYRNFRANLVKKWKCLQLCRHFYLFQPYIQKKPQKPAQTQEFNR